MPAGKFRARAKRVARTDVEAATLTVSISSVASDAAIGSVVASFTINGFAGSYTAALSTDLGGVLEIVGTEVRLKALLTGQTDLTSTLSITLSGGRILSSGFTASVSTPHDAATTAFFAASLAAGVTAPVTGWKDAYDTYLFRAGKAHGWFDVMDTLYVFAAWNSAAMLRNVIQDDYHLTVDGAVIHTPKVGLDCAGTGCLRSTFNPASAPNDKYDLSSAHMGIGVMNDGMADLYDISIVDGTDVPIDYMRINTLGQDVNRRLYTNITISLANKNIRFGNWISSQNGRNNELFRNGERLLISDRAGTNHAGGTVVIGDTTYGIGQYSYAHFGSGMTPTLAAVFNEDMNAFLAALDAIGAPADGDSVTSVTQYGAGIGHNSRPAGRYEDGSYWIQGPVTISSSTPASQIVSGDYQPEPVSGPTGTIYATYTNRLINGMMLNPGSESFFGGDVTLNRLGDLQGYDGLYTDGSITDPTRVFIRHVTSDGSQIVHSDRGEQEVLYTNSYNVDPSKPGGVPLVFAAGVEGTLIKSTGRLAPKVWARATVNRHVPFTIVNDQPPAGTFRPPTALASKAARWNISSINMSIFPSLAIPAGFVGSLSSAIDSMARPHQIQRTNNLTSRMIGPMANHRDYGGDIATDVSAAAQHLIFNYTNAQKLPLVRAFIRNGLDVFARVKAGGIFSGVGGGNQRHHLPMLIAGLALNDAEILEYVDSEIHKPVGKYTFACDSQIYTISQTDVDLARRTNDGRYREPFQPFMIGTMDWGAAADSEPYSNGANLTTYYREIVGSSMLGSILVAQLITGGKAAWNRNLTFDYYDRYFHAMKTGEYDGSNAMPAGAKLLWNTYRGAKYSVAAPAKVSAAANTRVIAGTNTTIVHVVFDRLLNELIAQRPATTDFGVTFNGVAQTVSAVRCFGYSLALTLASPITAGGTVLVSHTSGANPLKDIDGNVAASFSNYPVTNNT